MIRYLPGAVLAVFGAGAYVIGCMLYLAYRRERDPARKSKPLMVYGIAMMVARHSRARRRPLCAGNDRNPRFEPLTGEDSVNRIPAWRGATA